MQGYFNINELIDRGRVSLKADINVDEGICMNGGNKIDGKIQDVALNTNASGLNSESEKSQTRTFG